LSGVDNIHNEAHYVASNIPFFLNVGFVCSVDKRRPLSVAQERSLDREEGGAENLKYKFRFAPKLLICLNQNFFNGSRIIAHFQITESKWGLGAEPSIHEYLTIFGINYQINQFLGMF